jgi:hypothetical protein
VAGVAGLWPEDLEGFEALEVPSVTVVKVVGAVCVLLGENATWQDGVALLTAPDGRARLVLCDPTGISRKRVLLAARLMEGVSVPESDEFLSDDVRPSVCIARWVTRTLAIASEQQSAEAAEQDRAAGRAKRRQRAVPAVSDADLAALFHVKQVPVDAIKIIGAMCVLLGEPTTVTDGLRVMGASDFRDRLAELEVAKIPKRALAIAAKLYKTVRLENISGELAPPAMRVPAVISSWVHAVLSESRALYAGTPEASGVNTPYKAYQ